MTAYHQLTLEQRYQIYALKKMGHLQTDIAEIEGVVLATFAIRGVSSMKQVEIM